MNETSVLNTAIFLNAIFAVTMVIVFSLFYNRSRLKEQDLHEEYIKYLKRTGRNILFIMWILMLVFQVILYFIVKSIQVNINLQVYVNNIFFMSILAVLPIRYFLSKKMEPRYKQLAIKTNSEIVIDFKYNILNKIFLPIVELPVSLAIIFFLLFITENSGSSSGAMYVYIMNGWFIYLDLRGARNLSRQLFKSHYELVGKEIMIFHGFVILFYFINIFAYVDDGGTFSWYEYGYMLILFTALLLKLVYYLKKYPEYRSEIGKINKPSGNIKGGTR